MSSPFWEHTCDIPEAAMATISRPVQCGTDGQSIVQMHHTKTPCRDCELTVILDTSPANGQPSAEQTTAFT
jgi:uncharacterized ParB-like nuclease family protein